jgi:hypothetical protein
MAVGLASADVYSGRGDMGGKGFRLVRPLILWPLVTENDYF